MKLNGVLFCLSLTAAGLVGVQDTTAQPGGFRDRGPFGRFPPGPPPGDIVRILPVLAALDADEDGQISMQELDAGEARLIQLDKNGDGKLAGDELHPEFSDRFPPRGPGGRGPAREPGGRPGQGPGGQGPGGQGPDGRDPGGRGPGGRVGFPGGPDPGMMLRMMPWMTALDIDRDGAISKQEMANTAAALKPLDKDNNGKLTKNELRPNMRGMFGGGGGPGRQLDPEEVDPADGAAVIPDHAAYQKLSYKGEEVLIDTFLAGLEFVKFTIDDPTEEKPKLYFINTVTHRGHMMFARVAGLPPRGREQMKGVLVYRPRLKSPDGSPGLYTFEFEPFDMYSFEMVKIARDLLVDKMPSLMGKIGYYPRGRALSRYEEEKDTYAASNVAVYRDEDLISTDVAYLPLNLTESFGRLRIMNLDERPGPREVVLYKSLPNELPRVAGIITSVRQTPLSHVNLRAFQDKVPNAFILDAESNKAIQELVGKYVFYKVTADGYVLQEASGSEVEKHFANMRPKEPQVPPRDLAIQEIRPLDDIKFEDSASVGVKAANVATMRTFDFPEGTVPKGFAVPFYLYDEFMKHNGFYEVVDSLLKDPAFLADGETQEKQLKKLRKQIKAGTMPDWMMDALSEAQQSFAKGTSIRCRSSTNNEDLPGFSGAGLYDSYTQHPHEGHLSKSIKQVYASLWNFRAFEEREFYRIDHKIAAMGVLVHPNFSDERVNGVAVTDDIFYETLGNYYLNSQIGEDLVTNPEAESIPEEILLGWYKDDGYRVMRKSSRGQDGLLLSDKHLDELRDRLGRIHGRFRRLYGYSEDDRFAMEIEFKITQQGQLAIKQARPWVFSESESQNSPAEK